jgi:hypothetical protein
VLDNCLDAYQIVSELVIVSQKRATYRRANCNRLGVSSQGWYMIGTWVLWERICPTSNSNSYGQNPYYRPIQVLRYLSIVTKGLALIQTGKE